MNETAQTTIPYYAHEAAIARLERINKRFWLLIIGLIMALILTNGGWIYYESQFIDEVVTVESNTDSGGTAIANASGEVIYNGNSESDG